MPEQNPIKRKEIFTVSNAGTNSYGDLIIQDTNGGEHRIGKKRSSLFAIFQSGAVVEVGIAEYMNKEYISEAKLSNVPPAITPVTPKADLTPKEPIKEPEPNIIAKFNAEDARIRSMALSYAKDLAVVKVIDVTGIIIAANQFYTYITSGKIETK